MTAPDPPITDHTFRASTVGDARTRRSKRVRLGYCVWLGTCDRPETDHLTTAEYRQRRKDTRQR